MARYVFEKGGLDTLSVIPDDLLAQLPRQGSKPQVAAKPARAARTAKPADAADAVPATPAGVTAEIIDLLAALRATRCDAYGDWLDVGMVLKHERCPLSVWDEWSKGSAKYAPGVCAEKWASFHTPANPKTKGSLWWMLKQDNKAKHTELQRKYNQAIYNTLMHDDDFAAAFFHAHSDRYLYRDGYWYSYTGVYWQKDREAVLLKHHISTVFKAELLASLPAEKKPQRTEDEAADLNANAEAEVFNKQRKRWEKHIAKQLGDDGPKQGIVNTLKGFLLAPPSVVFDARHDLFAFENAVYNSHTGAFVDPKPEYYISTTCGYEWKYGPDGRPAQEDIDFIMSKVREIQPDDGTRDFVLQAQAQCVEGLNRSEKMFIFTGIGRTGKSIMSQLHQQALGGYFGTMELAYLTTAETRAGAPNPQLLSLANKRATVSHETDGGTRAPKLCNGKIKPYITGDGLEARAHHSMVMVNFRGSPLFVLCNVLPEFTNPNDPGIDSKMYVIPFTTRFALPEDYVEGVNKRIDETLKETLRQDKYRDAYLQVMFDEFKKYHAAGFKLTPPPAVIAATNEYRKEISEGKQWARAVLVRTPGENTPNREICAAWNDHNRAENPDWKNTTAGPFGKLLKQWGYETKECGKSKTASVVDHRLVLPEVAADEPAAVDPPAFDAPVAVPPKVKVVVKRAAVPVITV